jgi:hypothetical protein
VEGRAVSSTFIQQFAGPMTTSWKALGSPVLTPEIQKKLVDGVHAEVGSRTIEELEAERDEILLGLLELRTKRPEASSSRRRSDGIGVATRTVLAPSELPGARAAE